MKTKYEEMAGGAPEADNEGYEGGDEPWTPRVIYTQDARPDLTKMKVPQLRLAQGMTEEVTEGKARPGQYVLTNFPAVDEVIVVPLAAQNIRVYKTDPRQRPKCVAPTGTHGIGDPGIECAFCPLKEWGKKDPKTGRSTRPPCTEGISMRAYSVTHRQVVDFQFMGRAVNQGQFIQQQGMAFKYPNFAVKMSSGGTKNDKGSWSIPALEMVAEIPDDHVDVARAWYEAQQATMAPTGEIALKELAASVAATS